MPEVTSLGYSKRGRYTETVPASFVLYRPIDLTVRCMLHKAGKKYRASSCKTDPTASRLISLARASFLQRPSISMLYNSTPSSRTNIPARPTLMFLVLLSRPLPWRYSSRLRGCQYSAPTSTIICRLERNRQQPPAFTVCSVVDTRLIRCTATTV